MIFVHCLHYALYILGIYYVINILLVVEIANIWHSVSSCSSFGSKTFIEPQLSLPHFGDLFQSANFRFQFTVTIYGIAAHLLTLAVMLHATLIT